MKYLTKPIFKTNGKKPKVIRCVCNYCQIIYWESQSLRKRGYNKYCSTEHFCLDKGINTETYRKKKKPTSYKEYLEKEYKRSPTDETRQVIRFYRKNPDYLKNYKGI